MGKDVRSSKNVERELVSRRGQRDARFPTCGIHLSRMGRVALRALHVSRPFVPHCARLIVSSATEMHLNRVALVDEGGAACDGVAIVEQQREEQRKPRVHAGSRAAWN